MPAATGNKSPVHPRVGGEHRVPPPKQPAKVGSSPRGRGTRHAADVVAVVHRFIPAWAGNTASRWPCLIRPSVHPRVGGEHRTRNDALCPGLGSSPRGRGTHGVRGFEWEDWRFIPAWAGNTCSRNLSSAKYSVHPRVGGEHAVGVSYRDLGSGSSPRGRGTPGAHRIRRQRHRFIPAWAGNTAETASIASQLTVHPRVGGEHTPAGITALRATGSSPRGRGTHRQWWCHRQKSRFIPAWAGNTSPVLPSSPFVPVHPRVGGEHYRVTPSHLDTIGSSPRGRGTRRAPLAPPRVRRFIPAWAGNTSSRPCPSRPWPVHPRVGGEHAAAAFGYVTNNGSSPRGRGTRVVSFAGLPRNRFIPAWAGNTRGSGQSRVARSVHPRVGGEHGSTDAKRALFAGSSPRGRGTLAS